MLGAGPSSPSALSVPWTCKKGPTSRRPKSAFRWCNRVFPSGRGISPLSLITRSHLTSNPPPPVPHHESYLTQNVRLCVSRPTLAILQCETSHCPGSSCWVGCFRTRPQLRWSGGGGKGIPHPVVIGIAGVEAKHAQYTWFLSIPGI